jgi:acetate---CoA ligase (ADP-forming)
MDEKRRRNLESLFKPRSIAILGASADLNKVSGRPLAYMLRFGYPGKVYPVNPKYKEIAGVQCYPSLQEIPGKIDQVMVIIPANETLASLEEALRKGVKSAIIISGGFSETGAEGKKIQQKLTDFARDSGMLIYGPNTTGFLSLVNKTVATFSQSLEVIDKMVPGNTGLITQSGAFGAVIFVRAMRVGLGISHWAATGNEADLEFCDFLEYMVDDPHTKVIAGFMAGVENGQKLIQGLDRAAQKGKPVILLKVGSTEASQRAAQSHTGAIVGSARAYEAVFHQKGVIIAQDIQELIDYSMALAMTPLPKGKRVGILTESGGGGVLLTERCSEMGLDVGEIVGSTAEKLKAVVPSMGSIKNPVDLTGQSLSNPSLVKDAIQVMLDSEDFDIVIPMLLMSKATAEKKATDVWQIAQENKKGKILMICWPEGPGEWIRFLTEKGICVSVTPTRCAQTLKALTDYADFKERWKQARSLNEKSIGLPPNRKENALAVIDKASQKGERSLNEYNAKKVLQAYGIPIVEEMLATSLDEAVAMAKKIGYPVVAKLISPEILHKTEAKVVCLNIASEEKLREMYPEIIRRGKAYRSDARIEGVLIQKMIATPGFETIVGFAQEPPFGPTILFGLGGIFVEVMRDVALRVLPVNTTDVEDMIPQIRGYNILKGVRGKKPADLAVLKSVLEKMAFLADELRDQIAEIDINPLIVLEEGKGAQAVDALILLRKNG